MQMGDKHTHEFNFMTEQEVDSYFIDGFEDNSEQDAIDEYNILFADEVEQELEKEALLLTGRSFDELVDDDLSYFNDNARGINKHEYSYIQSVTGDDEITTTDSVVFALTLIVLGPVLTGVKLSRHDLGISTKIGNYAEEYILTPPSREASFDGVLQRHKGRGVPYVLDLIKLKSLNPIRKVSELDLDFESKFSLIHNSASWVHKDWFTKSFHNIAMVMALAIYDFRSAKIFPFLHKTEGGCGGNPPFDSLFTAYAALHHFNKGKATNGIRAIMFESTQVCRGHMSPKKAIALQCMHAVQTLGLASIVSINNELARHDLNNEVERKAFVEFLEGKPSLPDDLLAVQAILEPRDYTLGAAVSHLVDQGLVMTELDVRMYMTQCEKISALKGKEPMEEVLKQSKASIREAKKTAWSLLRRISGRPPAMDGNQMYDWMKVFRDYYTMRSNRSIIRGLSYSDSIKVFPSYKVRDYFVKESLSIRESFVAMLPISMGLKAGFRSYDEQKTLMTADDWIRSAPLCELLSKELPSGIGPDDSRIIRKICLTLKDWSRHKPITFVVISSDLKDMGNPLHEKIVADFLRHDLSIVTMNFEYYLLNCVMAAKKRSPEKKSKARERWRIPHFNERQISYSLPIGIADKLGARIVKDSYFMTIWDRPNINRSYGHVKTMANKVTNLEGGCLTSSALREMNAVGGYAFKCDKTLVDDDIFVKKEKQMKLLEKSRVIVTSTINADRMNNRSNYC